MIFETDEDLDRENKAIKKFCSLYDLNYKKLGRFDVDFMIFNSDGEHIGFVEVKGRPHDSVDDVNSLTLSLSKACKLQSKRLNPIIVWALNDGIIFSKLNKLIGTVVYAGRPQREGSTYDTELLIRYKKQQSMVTEKY